MSRFNVHFLSFSKGGRGQAAMSTTPIEYNQSCVQLSSFCGILLTWSDVAIIVKDGVVDCHFGF
jgi:hypothetical protein